MQASCRTIAGFLVHGYRDPAAQMRTLFRTDASVLAAQIRGGTDAGSFQKDADFLPHRCRLSRRLGRSFSAARVRATRHTDAAYLSHGRGLHCYTYVGSLPRRCSLTVLLMQTSYDTYAGFLPQRCRLLATWLQTHNPDVETRASSRVHAGFLATWIRSTWPEWFERHQRRNS